MSAFGAVLATHVIVAIVGVGLVGAIPLVAGAARRANVAPEKKALLLEPLFKAVRVGFGLVFLSGVVIEALAGGAHHATYWFRGSVLLVVFAFVAHGRARAALRRGADETGLARVERWGYAMCGAVAVIAFLMISKPF